MSQDFILDTVHNRIAEKLAAAFFTYYRYKPAPSEFNSWRNSLRAMGQILEYSGLKDHGILLEYQLPLSSKRLDCLVCGHNGASKANAVIVELKQWDVSTASDAENLVVSWVGGRHRDLLHPSVQVGQYRQFLADGHEAFHDGPAPIHLSACCYLHNYDLLQGDPILDPKFEVPLSDCPLFASDGADSLKTYLVERLEGGKGRDVLDRVEQSRLRPSRKLMSHVAEAIRAQRPWVLLDEQLVVYERVLAAAAKQIEGRKRQVLIIRGGPGTGKSVIAVNLLGELLRRGLNAHYATGSKAFTETLWNILGSRSRTVFKYFNSYGSANPSEIDVLICDEAHRIRETSANRFTKKEHRSTKPQVRELMEAAKLTVFFVDDRQVVRPNEIGSSLYVRQEATAIGAELTEYELEVQFRCAGSDGFVNWVNNTLGIERTANVLWEGAEGFDFQIVPTVWELERLIRQRAAEGHSARIAAGFCWPWSPPRPDGTLVDDVVIDDYRRPWDAKPGNWKLAAGIPSASLWATDPNGIDQVGCVYNIQGFELDYVGVIWGRDLIYDFDKPGWVGDKTESRDQMVKRSRDRFVDLVKNTYRVLLSRGLKGCYVYFMDKDTERFVRTRLGSETSESSDMAADRGSTKYISGNETED